VARAAHLSPFHFLRTFKALHGVTPSTYLSRKRTGAAVRLISEAKWTLTEIAELVGFGKPYYIVSSPARFSQHVIQPRAPRHLSSGAMRETPTGSLACIRRMCIRRMRSDCPGCGGGRGRGGRRCLSNQGLG